MSTEFALLMRRSGCIIMIYDNNNHRSLVVDKNRVQALRWDKDY